MFLDAVAIYAEVPRQELKLQGNTCARYIRDAARTYGIPIQILLSISYTESRMRPYTLNVDGKGYYFKNKSASYGFLLSEQKRGARNIDIGCMQVSSKFHAKTPAMAEEMLDPRKNVLYAAKLLKKHYNQYGNWYQSVAYYHSRHEHGYQYASNVFMNAFLFKANNTIPLWNTVAFPSRLAPRDSHETCINCIIVW